MVLAVIGTHVARKGFVASFASFAPFVGMGYSKPSNLPPDISWSNFCSNEESRFCTSLAATVGAGEPTSFASLEKGEIRYTIMAG